MVVLAVLMLCVCYVQDQRVVTKRSGPGGLRDGEKDPESSVFSIGRGKRRQLLVTTPANIKVRLQRWKVMNYMYSQYCN